MGARRPRDGETLADLRPDLVKWWGSNNLLTPYDVSIGSGALVSWSCRSGEDHPPSVRRVVDMVYGVGCPYCSGRLPVPGISDLYTTHADLAKQWHPDNKVKLHEVSAGSNKVVWWNCGKPHHDWKSKINNRTYNGKGCPYCSNRKVLPGFNDLATTHPELAEQWHQTKNVLRSVEVVAGYNKKVWWNCGKDGHDWESVVSSRAYGNRGCPFCSNVRVLRGFNDLECRFPALASQWHPDNLLGPHEVSWGANKTVLWLCNSQDHEPWSARVADRTGTNPTGCPNCVDNQGAETYMRNYLSSVYDQCIGLTVDTLKWGNGNLFKVDYISADKLVVEYDGDRWHKTDKSTSNDTYKTQTLLDHNYTVVRLRQTPLPFLDLTHPNLLQVPVKWDKEGKDIKRVIDEVVVPWHSSLKSLQNTH